MKPLISRIDDLLQNDVGSAEPQHLADGLWPSLSRDERRELAQFGLLTRVRERIRDRRIYVPPTASSTEALPREGTRVIWPDAQQLQAKVGKDTFAMAAVRLGVSKSTLQRRCRKLGIQDAVAQVEAEVLAQTTQEIRVLMQGYSDALLAQGITIGLEQAQTERIYIGEQWVRLVDCTSGDLYALVDQYSQQSHAMIQRGAYYLALARALDQGHLSTVRDLCMTN